jgi:hypothetical protein
MNEFTGEFFQLIWQMKERNLPTYEHRFHQ